MDIIYVNTSKDFAVLDDGTEIPILSYYDHSASEEPVDRDEATQAVAGTDETGYYCIQLAGFEPVTLH